MMVLHQSSNFKLRSIASARRHYSNIHYQVPNPSVKLPLVSSLLP